MAVMFLFFAGGVSLLISSLISRSSGSDLFVAGSGVGVVELKGLLASPEEILDELTSFRQNEDIKAIVLRIDSPGGAVGASQEVFTEVSRTNAVKPVIASMGSLAASGGYYAALGARRIYANPGTLTGSIGVIVKFANLEDFFGKIGYKNDVVKSGALKDLGSLNRSLTPEERTVLQHLIDSVHRQFVRDIAKSRSMPEEVVMKLADGRIYSGEQARDLGLIDELGNFTDAVTAAAALGGLKDSAAPNVIYPRKKRSWLSLLEGRSALDALHAIIQTHPVLSYEWTGIQ